MDSIMDLCFLCTKEYNCVVANERIVSQVEYLLPEITIIKLGIPLRICSGCDGALCAFNKFKQSSVESSQRLEARIKGVQGPPLHTGSPPVVDDSEPSGAKPEKTEEIFIKEEYVEETPLDTQMHTNRAFLDPVALVETIIAEPLNQLHKDRVSQNIQLHTDTNADNIKEIFIKEEQIEETHHGREFYNNILKEECVSNSINDNTDRQPEDKSSTLNTNEEVWERNSTDSEEETDGNCSKNIQTGKTKSFSCSICNKKFKRKYIRNRHMKIHSGVKEFHCEICEKSFMQKVHLTNHMKIHTAVKDFKCEICNKSFTWKGVLIRHMKIHSGVKNIRYETSCEICGKILTQKGNLTKHMKIHFGFKDFQCEVCAKSFTQKAHLNVHMKTHSRGFECYM